MKNGIRSLTFYAVLSQYFDKYTSGLSEQSDDHFKNEILLQPKVKTF